MFLRLATLLILLMIEVMGMQAQCPVGQVEVGLAIRTDSWGHEGYWELHPMDSLCGDTNSRIAFGGNDIDVGCEMGMPTAGSAAFLTPSGLEPAPISKSNNLCTIFIFSLVCFC